MNPLMIHPIVASLRLSTLPWNERPLCRGTGIQFTWNTHRALAGHSPHHRRAALRANCDGLLLRGGQHGLAFSDSERLSTLTPEWRVWAWAIRSSVVIDSAGVWRGSIRSSAGSAIGQSSVLRLSLAGPRQRVRFPRLFNAGLDLVQESPKNRASIGTKIPLYAIIASWSSH